MSKGGKTPERVAATKMPAIDLTATEAAWKKHEARARALPAEGVNAARLDLTLAAAIARAGAHNLLAQEDALRDFFRDPPLERFARVEEVALAALHADLLHRAANDTEAPFADVLPRVDELRSALLADLAAQVRRKRAPERFYEEIRAGDNSVRDKANDLNDLAQWYRENWSKLGGKTTVEEDDIAAAGKLAMEILAKLGVILAGQTPKEGQMSTSELRRRAFTLLEQDYEVVRHYGAFMFYGLPGGWEAYVPSLWVRGSDAAGKAETPDNDGVKGDQKPA